MISKGDRVRVIEKFSSKGVYGHLYKTGTVITVKHVGNNGMDDYPVTCTFDGDRLWFKQEELEKVEDYTTKIGDNYDI